MKTTIDMARESKLDIYGLGFPHDQFMERVKAFEALIRADEREVFTKKTEEFARKWWKIHCDSNLHYSSTLKAHQDFCALQAAIRARGSI
jgi:hypothetical protein